MKLFYANSSLDRAEIVVLGLPYDRTSSFIPGSRFGPVYMRLCTENIEDYSPYQKESLSQKEICDFGDISFETRDWEVETKKNLASIGYNKKIIGLGGEHTVSLPLIRFYKEKFEEITVFVLDAHCDLRDQYLGEKICHATVMRRVSELIGVENLYQFGIRSGTEQEFGFHKHIYKFEVFKPLSAVINTIKTPIYLSIDVDVLDPGVAPAVATPCPGGVSYQELVQALLLFRDKEVVGADIVEYNPLAASPWQSGTLAAELLRELTLILG